MSSPPQMVIRTNALPERRALRFQTLDDVSRDAGDVASRPGRTLGNWTVARILDHLAISIRAGFDGPEVRAPWYVRMMIAPLIRERMLAKGMPAGFRLPRQLAHFMPGTDATVAGSLQALREWLGRLEGSCPQFGHPAFGRLSHADWIRLHLRHAELHLSFVVPEGHQ